MLGDAYWIEGTAPGRLAIIPRPRGGEWLTDDLTALRDAGVEILVSLLTPRERVELDLVNELQTATAVGLEPVFLPIPDRGIPDSLDVARPVLTRLSAALTSGHTIVVHCRLGVGRSSLIAASLLVLLGRGVDEAWQCLAQARGLPVPDTDIQRAWLDSFTQTLQTPGG